MKIQQQTHTYQPITIKLEKKHEADALFSLIDKLDRYITNDGAELHHDGFSESEEKLIRDISDSRCGPGVPGVHV